MRRYDMTHDPNSGNWKMARSDQGQYVPWVDVMKTLALLAKAKDALLAIECTCSQHTGGSEPHRPMNIYCQKTFAREALASIEAVTWT